MSQFTGMSLKLKYRLNAIDDGNVDKFTGTWHSATYSLYPFALDEETQWRAEYNAGSPGPIVETFDTLREAAEFIERGIMIWWWESYAE